MHRTFELDNLRIGAILYPSKAIPLRINHNLKGDTMITINGKKFAESDAEFVDSLFASDGTCVGYAKRLKHSVKLFDHQHKLIGTITKYGVLAKATPLDNGKVWYSYGDIDEIGCISVSKFREDLDAIKTEKLYKSPEYSYKFK